MRTPARPPAVAAASNLRTKKRTLEAELLASDLAFKPETFLSAMPAEVRAVATTTLADGLEVLMEDTNRASEHMLEFLQGEAQLAHLDYVGLQDLYEEDEQEDQRLGELFMSGQEAEQLAPLRWRDVGFRLRSSCWDQPATQYPEGEDTNFEDSAQ